ncbi:hypothetical protein MNBD_GAMMA12-2742 [hydrothermal vent metagenome]|uniref:Beta-ketoacyl synthase N-terminal domain-containing protein n=1 Tax=hydrothermal vent metagenome TaxID=652676 RepID=A0A3B0Y0A7_9ZZZZ
MRSATQKKSGNAVIIGHALKTSVGDQSFLTYGALIGNMGKSLPSSVYEQKEKTGAYKPVLVNQIDAMSDYVETDRIYSLLEESLNEMIAKYIDLMSGKRILICVLTPSTASLRGEFCDVDDWSEKLKEKNEFIAKCSLKLFPSNEANALTTLDRMKQVLADEKVDYIIYGGVDSLLDQGTSMELALQRKLQTVESPDGIVLGEAAGFILLKNADKLDENEQILASMTTCAVRADLKGETSQDLLQCINSVLQSESLTIDGVSSIYHTLGESYSSRLEWHRLAQQLWASEITEQQRIEIMLDESESSKFEKIRKTKEFPFYLTFGNIGAADIFIKVINACEAFQYAQAFSPHLDNDEENVVVCDTSLNDSRGALLLTKPQDIVTRVEIDINEQAVGLEEVL